VKKGDLVAFSGSYVVYDPDLDRAMIEMNIQSRKGIILESYADKVVVLSNDLFCTLCLDDEACFINMVSES
jgi:hypothetical protein